MSFNKRLRKKLHGTDYVFDQIEKGYEVAMKPR